jgi:hypothetical protein
LKLENIFNQFRKSFIKDFFHLQQHIIYLMKTINFTPKYSHLIKVSFGPQSEKSKRFIPTTSQVIRILNIIMIPIKWAKVISNLLRAVNIPNNKILPMDGNWNNNSYPTSTTHHC